MVRVWAWGSARIYVEVSKGIQQQRTGVLVTYADLEVLVGGERALVGDADEANLIQSLEAPSATHLLTKVGGVCVVCVWWGGGAYIRRVRDELAKEDIAVAVE